MGPKFEDESMEDFYCNIKQVLFREKIGAHLEDTKDECLALSVSRGGIGIIPDRKRCQVI